MNENEKVMPSIMKPKLNPDVKMVYYMALGSRDGIGFIKEKFPFLDGHYRGHPLRITLAYSHEPIDIDPINRKPETDEVDTFVYDGFDDGYITLSHPVVRQEESGQLIFAIALDECNMKGAEHLRVTRELCDEKGAVWHLNNGVYDPYIKVCPYVSELEEAFLSVDVKGIELLFPDIICSRFGEVPGHVFYKDGHTRNNPYA